MAEHLGDEEVRRALEEDRADDDITTRLLGPRADRAATGTFLVEEACVVAGLPVVREVFRQLGLPEALTVTADDGTAVQAGMAIATAHGPARVLLAGERTALNFLQRLSAIATRSRAAVAAVAGTGAVITDTRKTTPGLRALEKYAVRVGGGVNHRLHLADGILWKDNHWQLLDGGDLAAVLRQAPSGVTVAAEVETEAQLEAALAAGVERILVDNASPEQVADWARRAGPKVAIEASGGITVATARRYAEAGARYISMGALTHSAAATSISFNLHLAG